MKKLVATEIESLKIGDSIKVFVAGKESLWVEVVEITNSIPKKIKGKIDSDPIYLDSVKIGDAVSFDSDNVIDVLKN